MDNSNLTASQVNRCIDFFEKKTGKIPSENFVKNLTYRLNYNDDPLSAAVHDCYTDLVEFLIKDNENLDLDKQDRLSGDTALITASFYGAFDIVALLIQAKVNLQLVNKNGHTALSTAAVQLYCARKENRDNHLKTNFWLLSVMSAEQIEAEIKTEPNCKIKEVVQEYNQTVLANQKKMFEIFGACLIKEDNESLLINQPLELIAVQLAQCFPQWYENRILSDCKLVFSIIIKMKENRQLAAKTLAEETHLFTKLVSAPPEESVVLIEKLGERYTYHNCRKQLGVGYAARALASDMIAAVVPGFSPAVTFCYSSLFSKGSNKREREEEYNHEGPEVKKRKPDND